MQGKHVKMLKQAAFVGFTICFVSSGFLAFAGEKSKTTTNYEKVFTDPEKTRQEKWRLVENAEAPLSEVERKALQKMVREEPEKKTAYFALSTLVKVRDTESVEVIIEMLKRQLQYGRYYALALGYLGDDEAIPVLEETMKETEHNYVRDDCRFALRLLGASTDESPPAPTEDNAVKMELTTSKKQITPGESFVLKASIKNLRNQPVRISPDYNFFEDYLKVYAKGGQYVLRFREGFYRTRALQLDDFPKISAGKSMTVKQECTVKVEKVFADKWEYDGHKAFVFHPNEDPHHLFDVGMYKPGRELSLQLVLIYDASHHDNYADFKAKAPLVKGKIVTNTITLDIKAPDE